MKLSRALVFWIIVIIALLLLEVAQLTNLFQLGVSSILGNVLSFIFALLLVTVLALVGAVFVGIFIAHRILSPQGFSPFEEEMLRMRRDVIALSEKLDRISAQMAGSSAAGRPGPPADDPPGAASAPGGPSSGEEMAPKGTGRADR